MTNAVTEARDLRHHQVVIELREQPAEPVTVGFTPEPTKIRVGASLRPLTCLNTTSELIDASRTVIWPRE